MLCGGCDTSSMDADVTVNGILDLFVPSVVLNDWQRWEPIVVYKNNDNHDVLVLGKDGGQFEFIVRTWGNIDGPTCMVECTLSTLEGVVGVGNVVNLTWAIVRISEFLTPHYPRWVERAAEHTQNREAYDAHWHDIQNPPAAPILELPDFIPQLALFHE